MSRKVLLFIIVFFVIIPLVTIFFMTDITSCISTTGSNRVIEPIGDIPVKIEEPISKEPEFFSQSPQEGLIEALEYYGIEHPHIVYAQAILETGYFKSNLCITHNNLFGLYNSRKKKYFKFNHWAESVKAYKNMIQSRYKSPGNYYNFLKRIRYARDTQYINKLKKLENEYGRVKQDTSSSSDQQAREGDGNSSKEADCRREGKLYSFRGWQEIAKTIR